MSCPDLSIAGQPRPGYGWAATCTHRPDCISSLIRPQEGHTPIRSSGPYQDCRTTSYSTPSTVTRLVLMLSFRSAVPSFSPVSSFTTLAVVISKCVFEMSVRSR